MWIFNLQAAWIVCCTVLSKVKKKAVRVLNEVQRHENGLLTSALGGDEWSDSRSGRFTSR
jgi:hypothetical protein